MKGISIFLAFILTVFVYSCETPQEEYDVCVYGATSAGVMAAYTAKMQGKSVIILESSEHLGGLTTGGLGQTDIGNKYAITGLSRDFYRKIGSYYGKLEQWTFEPHVAQNIFKEYLSMADLEVAYLEELHTVNKKGTEIISIDTQNAATGKLTSTVAKVFIDCTYEGDLMAKAGISHTVGRESNATYGENWNGVQLLDKHQFMNSIDPYKEEGNPDSGLLWGISNKPLAAKGSGDTLVQAYNFRMCLTDSVENQVPITKPEGYDAEKFELLLRYIEEKQPDELNWALMHIQPMPGRKTDINNSGPFSTDYIGANYDYPNASYLERKRIVADHRLYTQSLFYFLGNDLRVPEHLREEMKKWGYPKDEYPNNKNFSPQLYVREARRMVSDYVMTEKHCVGDITVNDGIGMAAYTMDSHNCQRLVVNGTVKNEGDVQVGLGGLPPYPISYKSIIPKKAECTNLVVPVCLSASHIAFGSIRMEPVFMVLGQSAGLAASLATDFDNNLHQVPVKKIQQSLTVDPTSDGRAGVITLDNDDISVDIKGSWKKEEKFRGKYGKSLLISDGNDAEITYQYAGLSNSTYDLYAYFPSSENTSSTQEFMISHNGNTRNVSVKIDQQSTDWVRLTSIDGNADKNISIKIMAKGFPRPVIADAFILLPVKS